MINRHFFRSLSILLLSLFIYSASTYGQTELTVYSLDEGSVQSYTLDETGRLYFDRDYLVIDNGVDAPALLRISSIRKILLSEIKETGLTDLPLRDAVVSAYPNPCTEVLYINIDSDEDAEYAIYSTTGSLLLRNNYQKGTPIEVGDLSPGLYLLKLNNTIIKFCKQ